MLSRLYLKHFTTSGATLTFLLHTLQMFTTLEQDGKHQRGEKSPQFISNSTFNSRFDEGDITGGLKLAGSGLSQRDIIGAGLNMGFFLHPGKSLVFISTSCPVVSHSLPPLWRLIWTHFISPCRPVNVGRAQLVDSLCSTERRL